MSASFAEGSSGKSYRQVEPTDLWERRDDGVVRVIAHAYRRTDATIVSSHKILLDCNADTVDTEVQPQEAAVQTDQLGHGCGVASGL